MLLQDHRASSSSSSSSSASLFLSPFVSREGDEEKTCRVKARRTDEVLRRLCCRIDDTCAPDRPARSAGGGLGCGCHPPGGRAAGKCGVTFRVCVRLGSRWRHRDDRALLERLATWGPRVRTGQPAEIEGGTLRRGRNRGRTTGTASPGTMKRTTSTDPDRTEKRQTCTSSGPGSRTASACY